MEYGSIEREIYIEASPEIVFDVVSSPEHLKRWWPDDAHYDPTPGSTGKIVFGDGDADGAVVAFTVVDARPPRTFSFRWTHPADQVAATGNSLLVFPEGTRTVPGRKLNPLKPGFALIASRARAPVRVIIVRSPPDLVPKGWSWWRARSRSWRAS